jgi:Mg-chelatase subunit ChlD
MQLEQEPQLGTLLKRQTSQRLSCIENTPPSRSVLQRLSRKANKILFRFYEGFRDDHNMRGSTSKYDEDEIVVPATSHAVFNAFARKSLKPPKLSLSISPEHATLGLGTVPSFYVRLNLKYVESDIISAKKVPLDIVCVLDNSGSMDGSKICSLVKAMDFVVSALGEHDRLSVVSFNSSASVMFGLQKMTASNKSQATRKLHELSAGGGTNILDGMQQGWSILENRRTKNPASCVFLLTDGQDRDSLDRKMELARNMKSCGTSLFVFGFGADHDSQHMVSVLHFFIFEYKFNYSFYC